MADQTADSRVKVRKVTDVHANYSEQGEYTPGKFSFQLILDNGAVEEVLMTTAADSKVLLKLLGSGRSVYFDTERRVVVFNDV